jgi:hypothetical protein
MPLAFWWPWSPWRGGVRADDVEVSRRQEMVRRVRLDEADQGVAALGGGTHRSVAGGEVLRRTEAGQRRWLGTGGEKEQGEVEEMPTLTRDTLDNTAKAEEVGRC